MFQKYFQKSFAAVLLSFVFTGCLTIRPAAVKAGKSLYETFLAGNGHTMYFLKPLHFKTQAGKGAIDMDFTFSHKNVSTDTVSIKFSVLDEQVLKSVDSMRIISGTTSVLLKPLTHMFSDRGHGEYINRFSTITGLDNLKALFDHTDWSIKVYSNGQSRTYVASGKTEKNIDRLRQHVFAVL
ncbi:MAG: hypothetical protein JNL13_09900 [Chitinophagaceae bacterium]|nr:hypothetical protein [Chitinophagaceae bacterium]